MPSELFSTRLFILPCLALCLALGTGCEEEDPFAHLRDSTSDSDGDEENEDDDGTTGGSKKDDGDDDKKTDGDDDKKDSEGTTGKGDTDNSSDSDDTSDNTGSEGEQDTPKNKMCDLRPAGLAILGDATAAGKGVDEDETAFRLLHGHLKSKHGLTKLSYENHGVEDSKFVKIEQAQMHEISSDADGPMMVVIHAGSHDLAGYIFKLDDIAKSDFNKEWKKSLDSLNKLVAHFDDKDKFPNGTTIILNTIYNPFDDCQEFHGVVKISKVKTELMGKFNQNMRDFADDHDNVFIADQHPAFLGHGHHHDNKKCPHYKDGSEYLMKDLTNLNAAGHAFMGKVLKDTVDKIFKGCE